MAYVIVPWRGVGCDGKAAQKGRGVLVKFSQKRRFLMTV